MAIYGIKILTTWGEPTMAVLIKGSLSMLLPNTISMIPVGKTCRKERNLDPNKLQYVAGLNGSYLATRLLNHNGITVAFALGRTAKTKQLFFDYPVLNTVDQETPASGTNPAQEQAASSEKAKKLDSQCCFENVKTLRFLS